MSRSLCSVNLTYMPVILTSLLEQRQIFRWRFTVFSDIKVFTLSLKQWFQYWGYGVQILARRSKPNCHVIVVSFHKLCKILKRYIFQDWNPPSSIEKCFILHTWNSLLCSIMYLKTPSDSPWSLFLRRVPFRSAFDSVVDKRFILLIRISLNKSSNLGTN